MKRSSSIYTSLFRLPYLYLVTSNEKQFEMFEIYNFEPLTFASFFPIQ